MLKFHSRSRRWLVLSLALFALAVASPAGPAETVYAQTDAVIVYGSPTTAAPATIRVLNVRP